MTCAILIVDGYARRGDYDVREAIEYPWIGLCLQQLARYDAGHPFNIYVWDNARLRQHTRILREHRVAVRRDRPSLADHLKARIRRRPVPVSSHSAALDQLIREVTEEEYIVTLDNDAFPIRDGWLADLIGLLEEGATLAGVYRDEMQDEIAPFIHVSCLAARRSNLQRLGSSYQGRDVGYAWSQTVLSGGGRIAPLRRSNLVNHHFLMGGIYGDLVYHQGAGSRPAKFWRPTEAAGDEERIRQQLRDRAFADLDGLISELRGS
jgi:glycosyl transferase family 2